MKNEFSYYSTTPLITQPVVINPDHLLLCGPHARAHCESISHNTYPVALPLLLTPTALNIVLWVFLLPLSCTSSYSLLSSIFLSSSFLSHSLSSSLITSPSAEPNFVSSYDIGNFTYFFFRENAVEHDCGRTVFSRAGRVCKNDIGGRFLLEDTWTTFMKARLNCSRPGEIPFNYNELQGTFYLPELELLYGIFTTNVWVTWDFTEVQWK